MSSCGTPRHATNVMAPFSRASLNLTIALFTIALSWFGDLAGAVSARSPNQRKCGDEESYDKVQGSAGGHQGICGPGGLARRHDGGPPVEGNLRQEPRVA